MGRGTETASIVLVLGTSTAGKSTIIEAVLAENSKLAPEKKLDWQVDGHDLMSDRLRLKIKARAYEELRGEENFTRIQELQPRFSEQASVGDLLKAPVGEIFKAIHYGSIFHQGHSLNLLDEQKFNQEIGGFLDATGGLYGEEVLRNLQSLTVTKNQIITEMFSVNLSVNNLLFDQAIENSKNGKPTILDLVPSGSINIVEEFIKYLDDRGHLCPIHVALVHLSVGQLTRRMEERNQKAQMNGTLDIRNDLTPFEQYSSLFGQQQESRNQRPVGELVRQDLVSAIEKFGNGDEKRAKELMEKFCFSQVGGVGLVDQKPVTIVAISPFDRIYDTQSQESTTLIAQEICSLATANSRTPDRPHPVVEELKLSQLFQNKQRDHQ